MLNKVMLIGRLGRDPEVTNTQSGTTIARMSVATDESYKDKDGNKVDKAEWHRIVCFNNTAKNCERFLSKGSLVFVEGSLQTTKWQDKDGNDKYATEVKAHRVVFLERKSGEDRSNQPPADAYDDNAPAFPTEAAGLDDVPFALLLVPFAGLLCHMLQAAGMVA